MMIHPSTRDETAPYETAYRPSPDEYADCRTPAEKARMARKNPPPVTAADFAPKGDTPAHAAARAADDIPF